MKKYIIIFILMSTIALCVAGMNAPGNETYLMEKVKGVINVAENTTTAVGSVVDGVTFGIRWWVDAIENITEVLYEHINKLMWWGEL